MSKFKSLTPNLMVKDVKESARFYMDILGFELIMAVPESQDTVLNNLPEDKNIVYVLLQNGDIQLMLQEEKILKEDIQNFRGKEIGASISLYIDIEDIINLYTSLNSKVTVVKELFTTWYGMNEFYIEDIDGYIIGFAESKK